MKHGRMKKLNRSNLSEEAHSYLRTLFLTGNRYSPGSKISVEELSRELGISRTPLWGAINRMEAEGILEVVPRQGVYLIEYDPHRVLEIYEAREALEGAAAKLAAERISPAQIKALQKSIWEQQRRSEQGDLAAYYESVLDFHESVAQIANNRTIERLLHSIFAQLRAMRLQRRSAPMALPGVSDDHDKILEAFEAKDPVTAEREARAHIRRLADQIRSEI